MKKSQLVLSIIIIAMIVIVFAVAVDAAMSSSFHAEDYSTETYIVRKGDTLWGIAYREGNVPDSVDVRDWIQAVEELNDTTANLQIGQRLTIYVYEE